MKKNKNSPRESKESKESHRATMPEQPLASHSPQILPPSPHSQAVPKPQRIQPYPLSAHKTRSFSSKQELRLFARATILARHFGTHPSPSPSSSNSHSPNPSHANPNNSRPLESTPRPKDSPRHRYPIKQGNAQTSSNTQIQSHALNAIRNRYASRGLCSYLESLIKKHNYKNIALFSPLAHEPDILPLLRKLRRGRGRRIFLPTMQGLKLKMLPYRLPLVRNYLGIFEPSSSPSSSCQHAHKLHFVLIPSLGIDMAFQRVGMGKGAYDRSFNPRLKSPYRVFVSQNLLISRTHITQGFDINAHEYISYTLKIHNLKGFYNVVDSTHRVSRIRTSCRVRRLSRL